MPQLLDVVRDTGRPWRGSYAPMHAACAEPVYSETGRFVGADTTGREWQHEGVVDHRGGLCSADLAEDSPRLRHRQQDEQSSHQGPHCSEAAPSQSCVRQALDNFIVSDDVRKSLVQARALKPLKALLSSADPELQKLAAMAVANIGLCKQLQTSRDSLQPNMVPPPLQPSMAPSS